MKPLCFMLQKVLFDGRGYYIVKKNEIDFLDTTSNLMYICETHSLGKEIRFSIN